MSGFIQNVTILVESIGLRTERFLENRIESARNALEREGEKYLHLKKKFIQSLVQHYKFKCYTLKKQ